MQKNVEELKVGDSERRGKRSWGKKQIKGRRIRAFNQGMENRKTNLTTAANIGRLTSRKGKPDYGAQNKQGTQA